MLTPAEERASALEALRLCEGTAAGEDARGIMQREYGQPGTPSPRAQAGSPWPDPCSNHVVAVEQSGDGGEARFRHLTRVPVYHKGSTSFETDEESNDDGSDTSTCSGAELSYRERFLEEQRLATSAKLTGAAIGGRSPRTECADTSVCSEHVEDGARALGSQRSAHAALVPAGFTPRGHRRGHSPGLPSYSRTWIDR